MTAALVVVAGGYGVHLLYTAVALRWTGIAPGGSGRTVRTTSRPKMRARWDAWLRQAGLSEVSVGEFAGAMAMVGVLGLAIGYAVFGGFVAPVAGGVAGAALPPAAYRSRRRARWESAQDAWPRMIEELRIHTRALGRSIPQALFDVGRRGPAETRPAFEAAHREWLLSTDFGRSLGVLKERLADPTADAACETLLLAHEVGGTDVDRRLESLVDDRLQEIQGRKDARVKQAGARFARRFVLVVPIGMAFVGMSMGNGRAAYATATGQLAVVSALAVIAGCWWWASRFMRVPAEQRVFDR